MKKGGYQVLNLECGSNLQIIDDFKNALENTWVNILNIDNDKITDYIENLFKYDKACLLKNIYIKSLYGGLNNYFNIYTSIIKTRYLNDEEMRVNSIYVIDSSETSKYNQLSTDDILAFTINDDYALVISISGLLSGNVINKNIIGKAVILKLYKGAITQ